IETAFRKQREVLAPEIFGKEPFPLEIAIIERHGKAADLDVRTPLHVRRRAIDIERSRRGFHLSQQLEDAVPQSGFAGAGHSNNRLAIGCALADGERFRGAFDAGRETQNQEQLVVLPVLCRPEPPQWYAAALEGLFQHAERIAGWCGRRGRRHQAHLLLGANSSAESEREKSDTKCEHWPLYQNASLV